MHRVQQKLLLAFDASLATSGRPCSAHAGGRTSASAERTSECRRTDYRVLSTAFAGQKARTACARGAPAIGFKKLGQERTSLRRGNCRRWTAAVRSAIAIV